MMPVLFLLEITIDYLIIYCKDRIVFIVLEFIQIHHSRRVIYFIYERIYAMVSLLQFLSFSENLIQSLERNFYQTHIVMI